MNDSADAMTRIVHSDDPKRPVFSLRNAISREACRELITFAEGQGFDEAPVTTAAGPRMIKELRNNTRVMVDAPAMAEMIWQRLREALPETLHEGWAVKGVNERLRFYRYDPGQLFDWHFDGAFVRSKAERSRLTLMLYLSDDFEGGETEFDDGDQYKVVPVLGSALVFFHGVRHRGAPVTKGRKYVLRTDVMYTSAV